jgi:hypothetical protein
MTEKRDGLWWLICSELDLYESDWPPQLASILLVMADHVDRVYEHLQDDTDLVTDVANWLRYEAQLAMEGELSFKHTNHKP